MLITILVINSVILVAIFLFLFLRPSENEKVIRELQSAFAQFTSIFDQSARSNREEQNNSITRLSGGSSCLGKRHFTGRKRMGRR